MLQTAELAAGKKKTAPQDGRCRRFSFSSVSASTVVATESVTLDHESHSRVCFVLSVSIEACGVF